MNELRESIIHDRAMRAGINLGWRLCAAGADDRCHDIVERLGAGIRDALEEHAVHHDEQAHEIARLRAFVAAMSRAPDSQVSSFVRASCIAILDGGAGTLPPGDPIQLDNAG